MESEAILIKKFQGQDAASFSELYDRYVEKIYNFIYYRTFHKETAEDLTSVVFTKAYERARQFSGDKGSFTAWLYQIARNTIIDHYRTHKSTEDIENAFDMSSAQSVERDVESVMQLEQVQMLLKDLPREAREVVIMRVWDGLSYKEIAEVLGKSEAASKMLYSRTIAQLKIQVPEVLILLLTFKHIMQ